ncbi:MAG: nitroreductase [Opitutaceae bacterium]
MELMDAIYGRRAVRDYTERRVPRSLLHELIDAAIQAPTALGEQPWVFAVIEGKGLLQDYSDRAKAHFLATFNPGNDPHSLKRDQLLDPAYNLFYTASTAVVIYAKTGWQFAATDCCLAAENFMLAAHGKGLGTCPVGFAHAWLDLSEIKTLLNISDENTAVLPIIVGYPTTAPSPVPRKMPEIVFSD